ncbi:MAG: hypothetical protein ABI668_07900 [Sphingorhabdus sp.]
MLKISLALAAALLLSPQMASATPIEQIECVYDAVPKEVHVVIDSAAMQTGLPAVVEKASTTALIGCMTTYPWSQTDSENSTRYFMMRAVSENSEKAMPADHAKIVQEYFTDNMTEFVEYNNFLDADPDRITADLAERGLSATDGDELKNAALYLYWLVTIQQLRNDFVAGKLRN